MDSTNQPNNERRYLCPIFNREISEWLCWEISNIGDDSLKLPPHEVPPCGWDEAYRICQGRPHYAEWE